MRIVISIILFFLCSFISNGQSEWTVEKREGVIQTYSRIKQGKDYYETRAIFRVKSTPQKVANTLLAIDKFKTWLPNTIDSKVMSRTNDSLFFAYTVTSAPWPLSNRDTYFKVSIRKVNNAYTITFEGRMNEYPLQAGRVRVKDFHAVWKITPLKTGEVEIDYVASFDPGGGAPNWVIKNGLIDARIQTALNLIELLTKS
jgi:hypothetical protein